MSETKPTPLIRRLHVRNFRSHVATDLTLDSVDVLFGPNTAGKSTLLDALWLLRDCGARGVSNATAKRGHGIGMLWREAAEGEQIQIGVECDDFRYEIRLGFVDGRVDDTPGETLTQVSTGEVLMQRKTGMQKVDIKKTGVPGLESTPLREPERLSLDVFQFYHPEMAGISRLDQAVRNIRYFHCRSFNLYSLRSRGSEAGTDWRLSDSGHNLWSILRNLQGRRAADDRYQTILGYLRRAFPSVDELVLDPSGPEYVTGSFLEYGSDFEVRPSAAADGLLQLLLILVAIFGENRQQSQSILLDEPETSLHPWAIFVLCEAVRDAVDHWGRQVLIASHSPVLLSYFEPSQLIEITPTRNGASLRRLSEREDVKDLLDQYAAGALYMSQLIGEQSSEPMVTVTSTSE
ncbi:AAA family ATPase [Planctellipticum variicoloris]|uniref:AAA family ATPase n=1 Tax=Planctellipticum variicoloris TaxID=3064265 RepID=UPI003013BA87|nr:AAA family ATPase [Planctomycetaceae bacterium SH412]